MRNCIYESGAVTQVGEGATCPDMIVDGNGDETYLVDFVDEGTVVNVTTAPPTDWGPIILSILSLVLLSRGR